jgi:deoxyadenosine/deoxycytidine kinase
MKVSFKKLPEYINYLCVEGVIGAGKTSLCNLLAKEFNGRLMLEAVNDNPFLSEFYKNRKSAAFQTQLWFILSRYRQLTENFAQQDLFHHITVSDYIFAKDSLFASINLDENEMMMYNSIATIIEKKIPKPDFVIYLQASTDVLLKRIEKRGRPYEFNMDKYYIKTLNEAYNHFFFHYTDSPVLIVNTDEIDLLNDDENLNDIVEQIHKTKFGSNYYRPLPSTDRAKIDEKKENSQ